MSVNSTEILQITAQQRTPCQDNVVIEKPLLIRVTDGPEYTLFCTPQDLENLVTGFLFTKGLITDYSEIIALKNIDNVFTVQIKKTTNTTPPIATKKFTNIKPTTIFDLVGKLQQLQQIFPLTGATHAALLFNPTGEILAFAEDIGRHNALDKAIGQCLSGGHSPRGNGIILSSRISYEIANKAATAGIEIIAAVSAASSLAISLANTHNMTLCGFVRNGKMNVYTGAERIDCAIHV